MKVRLQTALARCGVASRRGAERLIEQGRVSVNGAVVTRLGSQVDPDRDAIKVDGRRVAEAPRVPTYLMLHKPRGYVTTLSDPEGRRTVADLVRGIRQRVFPVGRLDYDSEGLLLLTDDGALARGLMHPSMGVEKTYRVKVRGHPEPEVLARLARGVPIDSRPTPRARARVIKRAHNSWLEVMVTEGRKHLVRKMLAALGHPVVKLRRTAYGGVRLGKLPAGSIRPLTAPEVQRLRRVAGLATPSRRSAASRRN